MTYSTIRFSKYGIVNRDAKPIRSKKRRHRNKWLKKNSRMVRYSVVGDSITYGGNYS